LIKLFNNLIHIFSVALSAMELKNSNNSIQTAVNGW